MTGQLCLKPNTKVFAYAGNEFVIGNDMHADFWSGPYQQAFAEALDLSADIFHKNLLKHDFQYIIIGERDFKKFGEDRVRRNIAALRVDPGFEEILNLVDRLFIFKVIP